MKRKYFILSTLLVINLISACAPKMKNRVDNQKMLSKPVAVSVTETAQPDKISSSPPADCPITIPQDPPFVPPPPYDQPGFEGEFWYGSNALWTAVPRDGTWRALPDNPTGYTQKVFWWREGYSAGEEPEPALTVTTERLDGEAPSVTASKATNASAGDIGSAMLVGVDLPALGCWRITGKYKDAELSFVVWVAP
jgi:hypothetical protein